MPVLWVLMVLELDDPPLLELEDPDLPPLLGVRGCPEHKLITPGTEADPRGMLGIDGIPLNGL